MPALAARLLIAPLLLGSTAVSETTFDFAAAWKEIAAELHQSCEKAGVVGGSLMFVKGKEVPGFEAHGFADRDARIAVDRDTIFHWASCTKTFTAIAIMQLRDRGRLRLDQPIIDFAPELRAVHDPFGKV